MVQKITWAAEAEKNLLEIKQYIEKDSVFYAERLVRQLYEKVTVLYQHPEFGKPVSTQNNITLRRILHKNYRIIYFIKENTAFVVAVFHQARQLPENFEIDNLFQ
jgi:plasmid stabilization system protein ParE